MSAKVTPHYGGDPIILEEIPGDGITRARGATVPADGAAGYAKGCVFIQSDGTASTLMYLNSGTKTSANFDPVVSGVQGEAITAGVTQLVKLGGAGNDFTISTMITTGWGFSLAAEAESFVDVVVNMQSRVAEIEARLESLGIIASN